MADQQLTGQMIGLSVVGIVVGLVFGLFGYRLFRFTLFLVSGVLFGAVSYALLLLTELPVYADVLIACTVGVVLGVVCVLLYHVAVFILGLLCGGLVGLIVLSLIPGSAFGDAVWPQYVILGVLALLFGVVFLLLQRLLIIAGTALFGSWCLVGGISTLADPGTAFTSVVVYCLTNRWSEIGAPTTDLWIEFACWGLCFALMAAFQFLWSAKHCDHTKTHHNNQYYLVILVPSTAEQLHDEERPLLQAANKWAVINAQNPPHQPF